MSLYIFKGPSISSFVNHILPLSGYYFEKSNIWSKVKIVINYTVDFDCVGGVLDGVPFTCLININHTKPYRTISMEIFDFFCWHYHRDDHVVFLIFFSDFCL